MSELKTGDKVFCELFGWCSVCRVWPDGDTVDIKMENGKVVDGVDKSALITETETTPHILDSGARTEYGTGAVRDAKEGKGRFDLMPLDVVADIIGDVPIRDLGLFKSSGNEDYIFEAIGEFTRCAYAGDHYAMLMDVSKHFEEGARKYGENNWQKGIPVHSYIDSAVRHYIKWKQKWNDEPHDRAFIWNLMCCIWTIYHRPELDDFTDKKEEEDDE